MPCTGVALGFLVSAVLAAAALAASFHGLVPALRLLAGSVAAAAVSAAGAYYNLLGVEVLRCHPGYAAAAVAVASLAAAGEALVSGRKPNRSHAR